jgi:hypothetical protein
MGAALKLERWAKVEREIQSLFARHLDELGGGELDLDVQLCRDLDAAGALLILTARDEDLVLQGYCIWTIGPSLEHAGELVAELRPWYVRPEKRNSTLAFRLFHESLELLRSRGIHRCFPHHWGNATLDKFFTRMGARPIEWVYELKI